MSTYTETPSGLLVPALDGLTNVATGLGTLRSKSSHNQWVMGNATEWTQLEAAYRENWIASSIVDIPAEDATKHWRTIRHKQAALIHAEETRLNLSGCIEEALKWAAIYGGSAIIMLTDQELSKPLDYDQLTVGSLKKLLVVDRWELQAYTTNTWNILADNYMQPEYYLIGSGATRIHWSHVIRFDGSKLPPRLARANLGWGDSVLRKCLEEINAFVSAKGSVTELLQEANIDIIQREGLFNALASDQDANIVKRYQTFGLMKSSINMGLLDSSESLTRNTLNLSGIAPVLEQYLSYIAGCAKIPVTHLFGSSAKGLNATGEGDIKVYHARIKREQTSKIAPALLVLDEVLVRSVLGKWDEDFTYEWNPLEQINQEEVAKVNYTNAQTDKIYLDEGIITPSQVQRNLQTREVYQFKDTAIAELESIEEGNIFSNPVEVTNE